MTRTSFKSSIPRHRRHRQNRIAKRSSIAKAVRGCIASLAGYKARGVPDRADAQVDQLFGRLMHCLVAFPAKRNQISFDIVTNCATPSQVMNIEILEAATYLTAPVIAHQDFFTQPRI